MFFSPAFGWRRSDPRRPYHARRCGGTWRTARNTSMRAAKRALPLDLVRQRPFNNFRVCNNMPYLNKHFWWGSAMKGWYLFCVGVVEEMAALRLVNGRTSLARIHPEDQSGEGEGFGQGAPGPIQGGEPHPLCGG